jgi:hypothetical protein
MKLMKNLICMTLILSAIFLPKDIVAQDSTVTKDNVSLYDYEEDIQYRSFDSSNVEVKRSPRNSNQIKLEEVTMFDILNGEKISPELRNKILELIDQYQYDLDSYRSIISNHYRQAELKIVGVQKDINGINNFKDEMEQNLDLAKWMIISLSVGIVCLTTIVIVMWRSVINVNRSDVEVIFSLENIKRELKVYDKRLDNLEGAHKNDGKQQIQNSEDTKIV